MNYLQAVLLGLLQGLTEFLPVSSSGHLALAEKVFQLQTPMLFDVLLHFATLSAIVVAFWKDILEMCKELGRLISGLVGRKHAGNNTPTRRLILLIVAGSLPLLLTVLGSLIKISEEGGIVETFRLYPVIVGLLLCATGLLLFLSDRLPRGEKNEKNALISDVMIVGVCQSAAALLPGFSRSGATISAGLFRGFTRPFAVRFSFLLSLPAVLCATLWELVKTLRDNSASMGLTAGHCIVGMTVAALTGYLAIGLVRQLIGKGKFGVFAYYCVGLGIVAIVISLLTRAA